MKTLLIMAAVLTTAAANAHHRRGVEPLMGAKIDNKSVQIQVRTGGCTRKRSFTVLKEYDSQRQQVQLTFIRVVPDYCEAYFPEGRVFNFSQEDLKIRSGQEFYIGNPFLPNSVSQ